MLFLVGTVLLLGALPDVCESCACQIPYASSQPFLATVTTDIPWAPALGNCQQNDTNILLLAITNAFLGVEFGNAAFAQYLQSLSSLDAIGFVNEGGKTAVQILFQAKAPMKCVQHLINDLLSANQTLQLFTENVDGFQMQTTLSGPVTVIDGTGYTTCPETSI